MIWGSNPGTSKGFFSFLYHPDQLLGPPNLLFGLYSCSFPQRGGQGMILTKHMHLILMSRKSRKVPLLPVYAFVLWTGSTFFLYLLHVCMCMHVPPPPTHTHARTRAHTHTHTHWINYVGRLMRPFGRPKHRWDDNIKMDLKEVGFGDMDWIELTLGRDRWRALMSAAMNLQVP